MKYIVVLLFFFHCTNSSIIKNARLQSEGILGGIVATNGIFRYHVSVQMNRLPICGGGIIGDNFVLTAAHCLMDLQENFDTNNEFTVVANIVNAGDTNSGIRLRVIQAYIPIESNSLNTNSDYDLYSEIGDIAVLKLNGFFGIDINPSVSKLELPTISGTQSLYVNEKPIITGFGFDGVTVLVDSMNEAQIEAPANFDFKLKFAEATVLSEDECNEVVSTSHDNHLCAKVKQLDPSNPQGVCLGDSGGPLVLNHNIVIGVLSAGPVGCNEADNPGLYVRVTSYVTFIQNVMNGIYTNRVTILNYN